jgi:dipeptidyl-peptidase-4
MKIRFNSCTLWLLAVCLLLSIQIVSAQRTGTQWAKDGYHYYSLDSNRIVEMDVRDAAKSKDILNTELLAQAGQPNLLPKHFSFSADGQQLLLNTDTHKVWRYDTRGDYWVYNIRAKALKKLGIGKPASSLMFAKFSPDGSKVAYVSEHNIYVEDLATGNIKPLTTDGTIKLINGTFDWVYEEEFDCRDGFRWSPDGRSIAYWQIDASKIKNYLMLNTTDSTYPFVVPVEYPVAGQDPSSCKVGVVDGWMSLVMLCSITYRVWTGPITAMN